MAEVTLDLLGAMLQRVVDSTRRLEAELADLKLRTARVEDAVVDLRRDTVNLHGDLVRIDHRLDGVDRRLERIERRLDLAEPVRG